MNDNEQNTICLNIDILLYVFQVWIHNGSRAKK